MSEDIALGYINTFEDDDEESYRASIIALETSHTRTTGLYIAGSQLHVTAYIDPATGKVADVEFYFFEDSPIAREFSLNFIVWQKILNLL